ncbi:MAG: Gfo/Idh/MocA family oxidoreductase [Akkermansiaceae bacterium]|nr:Gfo/Idh/MocA family oxidoreductase [Akkermansiaceae bacterium]NNM30728.1 Gfo/Idh/MocA family oxidoreductase [Akkermansiaceae bacterium]
MTTTRRKFLTTSAFAGTYSLLAPHARAQGANGQLRVAVVGVKGRGGSHIGAVLSHPKARLVALCDIDAGQLERRKGDLAKKKVAVETYTDYRKMCESDDIDAITIATCNHTHTIIALTAAAHGKHVYVEKPVSHNVWEGRKLAEGQEKYGVVIAHGFQRRSETSWQEAFAWLAEGNLGKLTLARGFCYKPRRSIGKVDGPQDPPAGVDYDLWSGPRKILPIMRKQFHYDWHWQSPYGNGDLGNQGPHQLDVCRWALGDPESLPPRTISIGGRYGYDDDGDTANTQVVWLETKPAPILFEVRGLPAKGLDWKNGMDRYKGVNLGNVIEYEGGTLTGGHGSGCVVKDKDGKEVRKFSGGQNHIHNWIDASRGGKQSPLHNAENGHLSAALAHIGNHSLALGKEHPQEQIAAALKDNAPLADSFERMREHLAANGLEDIQVGHGVPLSIKPGTEEFTGEFAAAATRRDREFYRKEFTLPNA